MSKVGELWKKHFIEEKYSYMMDNVSKSFFERLIKSPYIQHIIKYYGRKKGKVIEAGCGPGKLSVAFALLGYDVTAMDYNEQMLRNAEHLKDMAEKLFNKKLRFTTLKDDLERLKIRSGTYDIVFNEGVVEHWLKKEDRINVIKEMVRITKRKGVVSITVPNGGHPLMRLWYKRAKSYTNAPPMTFYTSKKLRKEMEMAGLVDIETDGISIGRSIGQWPDWFILKKLGAGLDKIIPSNKALRERFGVSIYGIGRKVY
ncbi:hypothetical protein DRN74_02170 [Candidatus Micrarchaeota archaeon]|nr:MAG: hypothetical protein DRN74_02170 [Candidatus Micrarchaeota archaeon]